MESAFIKKHSTSFQRIHLKLSMRCGLMPGVVTSVTGFHTAAEREKPFAEVPRGPALDPLESPAEAFDMPKARIPGHGFDWKICFQ
jgi:hypothetical protein